MSHKNVVVGESKIMNRKKIMAGKNRQKRRKIRKEDKN